MATQPVKKRNVQKQFFEVSAPLTSTSISLYAASPEELEGRTIILDMTRNLRGKNLQLIMRVASNNGKLEAQPIKMNLLSSYMRRVVRKGTDYIEDSFKVKCKDSEIIVKPFLITRKKVSRETRKALRIATKEHLVGVLTIRTALELFSDIMTGKIQKDLSIKLKKIYPLALCEIRRFEIIEKKE